MQALISLNPEWLLACAALIACYLLLRTFTLVYALHIQNERISALDAILVTGVGQFYSAITPSASGGQPMQVLALHRLGVSAPAATAALSMKYVGFQLAFLLLGAIMWMFNPGIVQTQLYGFRWIIIVGFLMNAILGLLLIMMAVNVALVDRIVRGVINLAKRLKFVKDADSAHDKTMLYIMDYRSALNNFKSQPLSAAIILGLSFLQVTAFASVVYCLYKAFGLNDVTYAQLTTLQLLLFLSASFMPLPGAAGAQEGGFYLFFKGIFPPGGILAAMLCWRFFTYYLLMISGLIGVVGDKAKNMYLKGRKEKRDD